MLGDEISLRKILNNLLSNANKFTRSGGRVTIFASQKQMNEKSSILHLEVADTGVGISEEFIGHLFEPYTQEMSENGGRAAGSGLGNVQGRKLRGHMRRFQFRHDSKLLVELQCCRRGKLRRHYRRRQYGHRH